MGVRPTLSLDLPAAAPDPGLRRTTCSACRLGIFRGQRTRWGTGLHLGLCHANCVNPWAVA